MARSNKYTSINFNDVFDKQLSSSPANAKPASSRSAAASSSYNNAAAAANYKSLLTQGRMLVLSRPSPKPIAVPSPTPIPQPSPLPVNDQPDDPISLRPLGRTTTGSPLASPISKEAVAAPLTSPKPNKFVPPHLRPGFSGKEARPEVPKQATPRGREDQLGRPKSGGYDQMRRASDPDLSRGGSFGARPSSS